MFLKKIIINRYRNFENTTVEFQDGVNIIVGPNNAGKTNLLRAINLLDNTTNSGTVHDFNKSANYLPFEEELAVFSFFYKILLPPPATYLTGSY